MATAKRTTRRKKETTKILDAVSNLQPSDVVEEIGNLQNTLQSTLAGLSAQISSKVEQMRSVESAIAVKESELQELYDIEKEAMSLEDIRASRLKEDENWNKEDLRRNEEWEQEAIEQEKKFLRIEEEHNYAISRQTKQAQDDFAAEVAKRRRDEAIRQDSLEREWKERSDALASKEQILVNLQAQVDGFDDRLKSEISKAEAIATNRVKRDYEHQIAMLQKDMTAEQNLNIMKISALDDSINGLNEQIDDLQAQLNSSRMDAKEITSAALQSASGHQAMQALQRVVDVGGQTQSKGK